MTVYDTKKTQVIWCGQTLEGFGDEKICVSQSGGDSIRPIIGIFGEYFYSNNPRRNWTISSSFLVNSKSYKLLEWDNLLRRVGSLIIRDLNLGTLDIFNDCAILSMKNKKDSASRQVVWTGVKRNYL